MSCADVENNGVAILHGIRGEFHTNYEPIFKQLYDIFLKSNIVDKHCMANKIKKAIRN